MGKQKLPLARARGVRELMPNKDALLYCFAIASTPEAADYLVEQFEKKLKSSKPYDSSEKVLARVKEYATNVHLQRDNRENPWLGTIEKIKTDFQNLQQNLADSALKTLVASVEGEVKMDFAVSSYSELLRAFSIDGKPLEPAVIAALDKLFNSSMAADNMISKNGVIFEATAHGEVRKDKDGNPIKAPVEKINRVISENFAKYLEKAGVQVMAQQHAFPDKKPEAAVKPQVVAPEKPTAPTGGGIRAGG
jgi:hypothetical protein